MIKALYNRFYHNFLMPSRLKEYEAFIVLGIDNNYSFCSVIEYYHHLKYNTMPKNVIVLRHDIDSDVRTAKKMFEIEQTYNITSSYYFRLSTLNTKFMKRIEAFGSEASYHFEELATYCKTHNIKTQKEAIKHLDLMQSNFITHYKFIKTKTKLPMRSVASHGDFCNRKIKQTNSIIIKNLELRKKLGIECETYDEILTESFNISISDKMYPVFYSPENIFKAINNGYERIAFLVHPRQWRTHIIENLWLDIKRGIDELKWRWS